MRKRVFFLQIFLLLVSGISNAKCITRSSADLPRESFFSEFLKELQSLDSYSESDLTSFSEDMFDKFSRFEDGGSESRRKIFLSCTRDEIGTKGCFSDWIRFSSMLLNFEGEIGFLNQCINTDDHAARQNVSYLKWALPKIVDIQQELWKSSFSYLLSLSQRELTTRHEKSMVSPATKILEDPYLCGLMKDEISMEFNNIMMDTFFQSPSMNDGNLLSIMESQKNEVINKLNCN